MLIAFLYRVDEHFSQALLNKLTEVPFDMMSFSLRKLDSSRWNSSSLDYLFKVHGQNVIDTSCDSSDNNNKLIVMTKSKDELVVPCLLNGVQMPNLRHNNNETQVNSFNQFDKYNHCIPVFTGRINAEKDGRQGAGR